MRQPYPWLQAYLKAHLDELKGLRNTPHDIKTAVDWFNALLTYFRQAQSFYPSATEVLRGGRSQRYQKRVRRRSSQPLQYR